MGVKRKKAKRQLSGTRHKLTATERIYLLGILPDQASHAEWRLLRELRRQVALSQAEVERIRFTVSEDGTRTTWKDNGRRVGITFSGPAVALIVRQLQKLDKEEKLTDAQDSLFHMFVGDGAAAVRDGGGDADD